MSCEVGQQLQKHEDLCREQAHQAFASDRESYVGLAHSSAAVQYNRVLEMHIRMGCQSCGRSYERMEVREFATR